ncbi:FAD/NAD(P)-binding protein [Thalassobaculum sp. OXR-137]|uniref:FAD/NAD(P)-binding protein n=1 Tax=Thalassobaculum sp. OXR-137 TaxID=3100173 RepID=UPI002AC8E07D|nr:FAD/NAD(P)-binding protein [Thalassobaculum sp. OXR-137]WPZ34210.1 FAD/NAD(P)-binding protein [Thalassobaculum sp. OXR-137]
MSRKIAIIGSGPTAAYTLKYLIGSAERLEIRIFESGRRAGPGMPYSRRFNTPQVLANIASIEIPPLTRTLVDWLDSLSDSRLDTLRIARADIAERGFYPRVVLGDYFADEFEALCRRAEWAGHGVSVLTEHRVADIVPLKTGFRIVSQSPQGGSRWRADAVVVATGHRQKATQEAPYLYRSPYPLKKLALGEVRSAAIIGSSLSGIDAALTLAARYGRFEDSGSRMTYAPLSDRPLRIVLTSRKGLLPEADFYYPIPEEPLDIFSEAAIEKLVAAGKTGLLSRAMRLFRAQLLQDDPAFFAELGLTRFTPEGLHRAYFARRERSDLFVATQANLAEARRNHRARRTVMWRYTLMRAHEMFSLVLPYLTDKDLRRFHETLKPVFADAYGCVPHASIAKLLALRRSGVLAVVALGDRGRLVRRDGAFCLEGLGKEERFETLIDARGQQAMTLHDLGFASLAEAVEDGDPYRQSPRSRSDGDFRLNLKPGLSGQIYCVSLPLLLRRHPFAQGLVSSDSFGKAVAEGLLRSGSSVRLGPRGRSRMAQESRIPA